MIESVVINNEVIEVSLEANHITLPNGTARFQEIANYLSDNESSHYLISHGLIYLENDEAVILSAAVTEAVMNDQELDAGVYSVFIAFDEVVYLCELDKSDEFVLVDEERLIDYDEAVEKARLDPHAAIVLQGGTLTDSFINEGFKPKAYSVNFAEASTKKGLTFTAIITRTLVVVGLLLFVFLVANYFINKDNSVVEKVVESIPAGHPALGSDIRQIGDFVRKTNILLIHGIQSIDQSADMRVPYITISGAFQPNESYTRLYEIKKILGSGILSIEGSGWTISSVKGVKSEVEGYDLRFLPADMDQLSALFKKYSDQPILTRVPVTPTSKATQYPWTATVTHPSRSLLYRLAADIETLGVHGRIQGFNLTVADSVLGEDDYAIANSAWGAITLTGYLEGKLK